MCSEVLVNSPGISPEEEERKGYGGFAEKERLSLE